MQQSCRSCSRNVLFTFLESVTGVRNTQLQHTRWLHHTRSMSSAISPGSSISHNANRYEDFHLGKKDFVTGSSDRASSAQNGGASIDTSSSRNSGNIKSWEEQGQPLFQATKVKQSAAANGAGDYGNTQVSAPLDDQNHSVATTGRLGMGQTKTAKKTKKIHNAAKDQDLTRDGRTSNSFSARGTMSRVNSMTPPLATLSATPRKKDRWRNRVASAVPAKSRIGNGHSIGSLSKGYKLNIGKGDSRSQGKLHENQSSELSRAHDMEVTTKSATKLSVVADVDAEIPAWKIHKRAVKVKLGDQAWNPLKRLSPDAREGVRQLHKEDPVLWSTSNLANHFQLSPDAIRRILKSKWTPTDKEREEQQQRWVRRGETIWDRYVEIGYKAPRKWRGLNPIPPPRSSTAVAKTEFKPEEWSQDQDQDPQDELDAGLGLGLENRIK